MQIDDIADILQFNKLTLAENFLVLRIDAYPSIREQSKLNYVAPTETKFISWYINNFLKWGYS